MQFDVGTIATNLAVDETIWVSPTHSSSTTVTQVLTSSPNASASKPQRMICVSDFGTNSAPVTAPSALEQSSVNGFALNFEGFWVVHGMKFVNSGTGGAGGVGLGCTTVGPHSVTLDTCQVGGANNTNPGASVLLGNGAAATNDETQTSLLNCVFAPRHANNRITVRHGQHRIQNLSVDTAVATPTILFSGGAGVTFDVVIENSDLSNAAIGTFFLTLGSASGVVVVRNVKLAAGTILCSNDITAPGLRFIADDITIGTAYVPFYRRSYAGEVKHETTIVATDPAQGFVLRDDLTEPYSIKLESANASYWEPLYSDWMHINVEDLATPITPYAEILALGDGVAALTDRECWVEVDVKNVAGTNNHEANRLTDGAGTVAAGIDQAVGTLAWTGHGYVTPRTHRLALGAAITPTQKGYIRVRVALAKAMSIYIGKVGV